MAQLVRCYFKERNIAAEDVSFKAGTAFEFALDVEFTDAEIALGGSFRVILGVKNFNTNVVFIPAPTPAGASPAPAVAAPANNIAAVIVAPRNQTLRYDIPAASAVVGQFLDAYAALVIGASGQDTDIGEASCVIIP